MNDKTNNERTERKPACTLEEARELIEALRARYQGLSPAERLEVRQALEEAMESSESSKASLPLVWGIRDRISMVLGRWADVTLNVLNNPHFTVWSTVAAGLWKLCLRRG